MLMQRVLTAIVGIIYIILMTYIGGWFFKISVCLMAIIMMHEFYQAFIHKGHKPAIWLGYAIVTVLFYYNFVMQNQNTMIMVIAGIILGSMLLIFPPNKNILDIMITIFGAIYPGMMIFFLILLAFESKPFDLHLLMLAFFIPWSTDTFAYFIGKKFGRRQLSPTISPNKTIEGSGGGLLGSMLISMLTGYILITYYEVGIEFYHFIVIGLVGSAFSQIGDLTASSIKRFCGVKDFGKFLPGHGGLLDRFDSLLFTLPIVYLYYLIFLMP